MPRTPQWTYDWWENALEYMFWINAAAYEKEQKEWGGLKDGRSRRIKTVNKKHHHKRGMRYLEDIYAPTWYALAWLRLFFDEQTIKDNFSVVRRTDCTYVCLWEIYGYRQLGWGKRAITKQMRRWIDNKVVMSALRQISIIKKTKLQVTRKTKALPSVACNKRLAIAVEDLRYYIWEWKKLKKDFPQMKGIYENWEVVSQIDLILYLVPSMQMKGILDLTSLRGKYTMTSTNEIILS